jgi:hypothetical protein
MQKNNKQSPESRLDTNKADSRRALYRTPSIKVLGTIEAVTQAGGSGVPDDIGETSAG